MRRHQIPIHNTLITPTVSSSKLFPTYFAPKVFHLTPNMPGGTKCCHGYNTNHLHNHTNKMSAQVTLAVCPLRRTFLLCEAQGFSQRVNLRRNKTVMYSTRKYIAFWNLLQLFLHYVMYIHVFIVYNLSIPVST